MTFTTSSMNPLSQLWPGGGPGNRGRGRPGSIGGAEELELNQRIRSERPLWLPPTTVSTVSPAAKQQPKRGCQPASEKGSVHR